jgi:hypothetical protein
MKKEMTIDKMSHDKQVEHLKSLLRSGKGTLTGHLAFFAFRHHLISKHSPGYSRPPVLRWYLGQLAKEYIRRYYAEAKETLEQFAAISLLETTGDADKPETEFRLNEALYPALHEVLEDVFGADAVAAAIARAKYYKDPAAADPGASRDGKGDKTKGKVTA